MEDSELPSNLSIENPSKKKCTHKDNNKELSQALRANIQRRKQQLSQPTPKKTIKD